MRSPSQVLPVQMRYDAYATNSTTPPASVIFRSASLLNHLARTTNGTAGSLPLPRTLLYPRGRRSRTGTVSFLLSAFRYSSRDSAGTRDQSYSTVSISVHHMSVCLCQCHSSSSSLLSTPRISAFQSFDLTYLLEVDDGLPELVLLLVEVPHSDLSKVTRMIFVHISSMIISVLVHCIWRVCGVQAL